MEGALPVDGLTDGRVTLRTHRPDDVPALLAHCREEPARRWTTIPDPYTEEHAREWVASRAASWESGGEMTLVVETEGRYAGQVGLRPDGAGAAAIGYSLAEWAHGRGVMSAAVRLMLTWGFGGLGLDVVHWAAYVGNWPSRRVAWATGFSVEGRVRAWEAQRGERRDCWVGSITAGERLSPRTPWLHVPTLQGDGVVLRRHVGEDAVRVVEACSHPSTQQWLPELPSPYTLVDAAEYLMSREEQHATGSGVYWVVADPDDGRLLGVISLMGLSGGSRSGEIGYWTHPDARGRGMTTQATRLAARHGLLPVEDGGLGLTRVLLRVADGNTASQRVAERAGFTLTGRDRDGERLRDGTVVDFLRYDLLASELGDPPQIAT